MNKLIERRRLDPEKTRESILAAALDVFADKGFEGASVADIASVAGVRKSLLQYHFGSKEDLWKTCLNQTALPALQPLDRYLDEGGAPNMAGLISARFQVLQKQPKVARMLAWASLGSAPLPAFLAERRERLQRIGTRDPSSSDLTKLLFALAAMDGWFLNRRLYSSVLGDVVDDEAMAEDFLRLLIEYVQLPTSSAALPNVNERRKIDK